MATIEEVYRELNFPSIRKLTIALRSRQIPFTPEELENLTRTNEVNQIYGPPPKYEGKITASRMHERWQVDLADMTSKPGKDGSDHILFVMDIFSREVWARSIKGATAEGVTSAFESILREAGAKPVEVNTDGGPEFANARQDAAAEWHQPEAKTNSRQSQRFSHIRFSHVQYQVGAGEGENSKSRKRFSHCP